MKSVFLHEPGITFQSGAAAAVARAATLAARRSTMGFRSHLTVRVQSAGAAARPRGERSGALL
ncbi:hypothetical protein PMI06_009032 [Burkholderia sp. BT03]|jgi:hypothetical protein|nr:hypothetical protein PMI06_009032 [Burkholderia sp. BT03]SKC56155.1 hypothetical protein SAMN06266956_0795 [Paraburkholderia hospita]